MTTSAAQAMATAWHVQRFPQARALGIFAKAVEEMGEVATALIYDNLTNAGATGKPGDVAAEAADVVICLLALVGRFYPDRDVTDEVFKKLNLLLTPGAHKSGIP